MSGIRRLSDLDASFLHLETAVQPLHVCSVVEVDTATMPGGYSFDRLRNGLALRLRALPEFREKLADGRLNLDHPVWVEDADFDVDRHLHRIGVPAPGGRVELAKICGHIASLQLDRSRPLWEMWVIENVSGTDARAGGQVAIMTKVHHASVDGDTGANLVSRLCSTEPDAPPPDPVEGNGRPSDLEIAISGAISFATRPLRLMNVVPSTISTVVDTIQRVRSGSTMAAPFSAPKTVFNANVTRRRNVAFAKLDLEDVKTVKDHFGVKVNDVVMAVVAGVLRRFLADRGDLPDANLVAMTPVSVRQADRAGRDQVSSLFSRLETTIDDPVERLKAMANANSVANRHGSAINATLLQDWAHFAAPAVFGVAVRLFARSNLSAARPVHNLTVSNVPGPQIPLYFLGSRVTAMFPLGPIFHGSGLNITVTSLQGTLDVGLISCPDLLPDLWDMADGFRDALDELVSATQ